MKNATPSQESSVLDVTDTSAHTQRAQIIALIKQYQSMNTPEFREHGIMSPAPRILELRAQGHKIEKVLETYFDKTGKKHSGVARYYFANNPPVESPLGEKAA